MLRNIPVLRPNPGELYSGPMHSNAVSHPHIKQMYPKTALLPDSLSLSLSLFLHFFLLLFCVYVCISICYSLSLCLPSQKEHLCLWKKMEFTSYVIYSSGLSRMFTFSAKQNINITKVMSRKPQRVMQDAIKCSYVDCYLLKRTER